MVSPDIPPNPPLSKTVTKFRFLAKAIFGSISIYLGYVILFKQYKKEDHWLIGPDAAPTTGGRIQPILKPSSIPIQNTNTNVNTNVNTNTNTNNDSDSSIDSEKENEK